MAELTTPLGLVADIGGTNGRFALVSLSAGGLHLFEQRQYPRCEFDGVASLIDRYLNDCEQRLPLKAVLAVAGPLEDNRCQMTNGGWVIDGGHLQAQGVFSSCQLINDFAAQAFALPLLQDADLLPIGPQGEIARGTQLVVGPGTGLGAAFLVRAGSSSIVLEGEGGHIGFAPVDLMEIEFMSWFKKKYGRVSIERLLSGAGLEDLFEARAEIDGRRAEKWRAEDIMERGLASEGEARGSLLVFCALLGSYAGDMALAGGCWGGVYIGGGIAPRMPDLLIASSFRQRFEAKGRFSEKMSLIPTRLITRKTPALLGAASQLSV